MAAALQIVDGFEGLEQVLLELHDRGNQTDFRPALDAIAHSLEQETQQNFGNRVDPTGEPWTPTFWFRWQNPDHETLEDTGRLRMSLTIGGQFNIFEEGDNEFTFGTSLQYAGIHMTGGESEPLPGFFVTRGASGGVLPPGTVILIPARPFLGFSEAFIDQSVELIADDYLDTIRN